MDNRRILIVGSGIAGPTLAYWLRQYGFEPTLIERAPALRRGGYVVDFWGVGYDVAEKMGILPALRKKNLTIDNVKLVDTNGKRTGGFRTRGIDAVLGGRYVSLLRSELSQEIYATLDDGVRTIFGDSVMRIDQNDDGVFVEFQKNPAEQFDLVIGAGGLHSPVRRLVFGAENRFEKYLGYYAASFSCDDYPHREQHSYVCYSVPGRQATRYTLQDGRTVFLLVFRAEAKLEIGHTDLNAQKQVLTREFAGDGWECDEILRRLEDKSDVYFDSVSQIRMQRWSKNRAALVGDACGSPSLLAAQGAALAMAGAYILAGELNAAQGDYRTAFENYEKKFQPVVDAKQQAAQKFAKSFVPKTRAGIFVRDQVTKLMNIPFVADLAMGRMLKDPGTLPTYTTH